MLKAADRMKGRRLRLSYLLFSFLFSPWFIDAQIISVKVIDDEDLLPLSDVEVFNHDYSEVFITNSEGEANIDTSKSQIFHFSKEGYGLVTSSTLDLSKGNWIQPLTILSAEIENITLIGRASFKETDKFHFVQDISRREIQATQAQTSADVLDHHGGVYVQKSQLGGGSPVLRGFEANRVLLVVDGVRMNNAIYRNGHLQNAITIDPSILQDVKVLFGPNSLAYGSDAIGGVVAYTTRSPRLSKNDKIDIVGNSSTRYSSASNEMSVHGDVSIGGKEFGSLTSISYANYGDLRSGSNRDSRFPDFGLRTTYVSTENGNDIEKSNPNPNVQIGSGYEQFDLLQKFIFQPKEELFFTTNLQYSTSSNIPRYDNLQQTVNGNLRFAEWYYGPQNRLLISSQIKNYKASKWYDKYILTGAFQKIDEDRISRVFGSPQREQRNEDVKVFSLTGEFEKALSSSINLLYGFDTQGNEVQSNAFIENIQTGALSNNILSRYANGANSYYNYGLFGELDWSLDNSPFAIKMGLRYSGNHWNVSYENTTDVIWPSSFVEGISNQNSALTWSISGLYNKESGFYLRSLISSAFRAPNIDDLSKIRINSNEITFPNIELGPENSLSIESTIGYKNSKSNISSTLFFTNLNDAIVRRPSTTPEGSSTYEYLGETLNVVANQNAQKAHIYGISIQGSFQLTESLSFKSNNSFTRGREKVDNRDDLPFAHIPPFYGNFTIQFDQSSWSTQFVMRYNAQKNIEDFGGSVDNSELATPIGSLGWTTLNIYSSINLNRRLSGTCALENLMDVHYRPFASGLSGPGRNIIIGLRYSWD